jgi:hypothetical protein
LSIGAQLDAVSRQSDLSQIASSQKPKNRSNVPMHGLRAKGHGAAQV